MRIGVTGRLVRPATTGIVAVANVVVVVAIGAARLDLDNALAQHAGQRRGTHGRPAKNVAGLAETGARIRPGIDAPQSGPVNARAPRTRQRRGTRGARSARVAGLAETGARIPLRDPSGVLGAPAVRHRELASAVEAAQAGDACRIKVAGRSGYDRRRRIATPSGAHQRGLALTAWRATATRALACPRRDRTIALAARTRGEWGRAALATSVAVVDVTVRVNAHAAADDLGSRAYARSALAGGSRRARRPTGPAVVRVRLRIDTGRCGPTVRRAEQAATAEELLEGGHGDRRAERCIVRGQIRRTDAGSINQIVAHRVS